MPTRTVVVVGAAILVVAAVALSEPATQPAEQTPAPPAAIEDVPGQAAVSIQLIKKATKPEEATEAYIRGCQVDKDSVELHEAYIVRMLALGLPKAAFGPANTLTALDPAKGLAWAVVAYMHCQNKDLAKALPPILKAAGLMPKDPCVLADLGQLVAWLDDQKKLKLPDVQDAVKANRADWSKQDAFATACKRIKDAQAAQDEALRQLQKKADATQQDLHKAQQQVSQCDTKIRDDNNEIANHQRTIDRLNGDLDRTAQATQRDQIRRNIDQENRAIQTLQADVRKQQTQGQDAAGKVQQKQKDLVDLRKLSDQGDDTVQKAFRWELPGLAAPAKTAADSPTKPAAGPPG